MQIKYIADPGMHSIPAVAVHPSKQWFIGTSLDNQIVTYAAKDRFRQNRKKVFKVSAHGSPAALSTNGLLTWTAHGVAGFSSLAAACALTRVGYSLTVLFVPCVGHDLVILSMYLCIA